MNTIRIGLILAMMAAMAYADDGSNVDACLKEAIRAMANAPHVSTSRCEAVMVEGMWIAFTNSHGEMKVTAGKGFERNYTWAGDTRSLVMWPRNERWYGSLGMYNPGSWIEGEMEQWKEHEGIGRCVAEEGQRHFTNEAEAIEWISTRGKYHDYIYNDTGLVVGMNKEIPPPEWKKENGNGPGTLCVDVWQVYINGKKPQKLEGAKNDAITVFYPPTYDMETVTPPTEPVDNFYHVGKNLKIKR